MTDTVPAAPAAPVTPAAPAAPVVPAAPPTAPAAPAAPPAAPAAPAEPAAPAAPASEDSLIPADVAPPAQTAEAKLAEAKALIAAAEAAADPNGGKAWLLDEGVMGTGAKPGWLKSDKYKSVAAQAAAYPELEKRLGSFVGAPKDGKYEVAPALKDVVQADHPMIGSFTEWAAKNQLSPEGYNTLLGMVAQYDAGFAPSAEAVKGGIGADADTRIGAVAAWGKANLGAEGYAALRTATSLDGNMHPNARVAAAFKVLEQVIAKTGQLRMPKPGEDVPGGQAQGGLDAIKAEHGARDANGKLKVDTVPGYRAQIDKKYRDYFAGQG